MSFQQGSRIATLVVVLLSMLSPLSYKCMVVVADAVVGSCGRYRACAYVQPLLVVILTISDAQ